MLKYIPLGSYSPGQSLLHRLQARTKLLLLLWLVIWLTVANRLHWHFEPYILALVFLALGLIFAGISLRTLWQRIWLLVLLTALGIWPTLTSHDSSSHTLLALGPIPLSYGALRLSLLLVGAVVGLLLTSLYLPLAPLQNFWQRFRRAKAPLWFLTLACFFLFWLFSGPPATQLFLLGPVLISDTGAWALISVSSFLLLLYAFSLLLTMTTSPMALVEGVTSLLAPLRLLKLPVDSFALMALLALRFIPTLLEQAEQLQKAQTSRGADLSSGSLRERFQSLTMLFFPLIHAVLREASDLATALEARGYQSSGRQTPLYESRLRFSDYLVASLVLSLSLLSLLL